MSSDAAAIPATTSVRWSDLLPELLGRVIAHLPFPAADLPSFRAVCRAWRAAARQHARQLPWIVLPDGSMCIIGDDGARDLVRRIPGLPEDVTCLGAAGGGWLALDCTDDVFRRTPHSDKLVDNSFFLRHRGDVMHRHTYLLHNPFSGVTVPLPELDSLVGHVAETFEIRKVTMRSSNPDDIVAITTNNSDCNIILCRPGKGSWVVPYLRVCDAAFHGDKLYGITPEEELVACDISQDEDGRPIVTKYKRVIMQLLADGEEDTWGWMYDNDDGDDDDDDNDNNNDDDLSSGNEEGERFDDEAIMNQEEEDSFDNGDSDGSNIDNDDDELSSINDDDDDDDEEEEEEEDDDDDDNNDGDDEEDDEDSSDDDASDQEVVYNLKGDGKVSDGEEIGTDDTVPYKYKDYIKITRRLVESCEGRDLLMVRHHMQTPPFSDAYTRKVEVFKADIEGGKWIPVTTDALAQGQALFLSRSFCKCTRAFGDIKEGFIYFMDMNDVFDTRSWTRSPLRLPPQWSQEDSSLVTWLFPPELVL